MMWKSHFLYHFDVVCIPTPPATTFPPSRPLPPGQSLPLGGLSFPNLPSLAPPIPSTPSSHNLNAQKHTQQSQPAISKEDVRIVTWRREGRHFSLEYLHSWSTLSTRQALQGIGSRATIATNQQTINMASAPISRAKSTPIIASFRCSQWQWNMVRSALTQWKESGCTLPTTHPPCHYLPPSRPLPPGQLVPLGGLSFPNLPSLAPSNTFLASSHNIPASSNPPPPPAPFPSQKISHPAKHPPIYPSRSATLLCRLLALLLLVPLKGGLTVPLPLVTTLGTTASAPPRVEGSAPNPKPPRLQWCFIHQCIGCMLSVVSKLVIQETQDFSLWESIDGIVSARNCSFYSKSFCLFQEWNRQLQYMLRGMEQIGSKGRTKQRAAENKSRGSGLGVCSYLPYFSMDIY